MLKVQNVSNISNYFKAVIGAGVAGLGVIASGLGDGSLTAQECVYATIAALVALGSIWVVPGPTAPPKA